MKRLLLISFIAMLFIGISGCEKEGPRGPRGPAGADGIDGVDGNANVTTILITDQTKLAWVSNYIQLWYDSVFYIPNSIRTEGLVLVYMNFQGSSLWYPVPGWGLNALTALRYSMNDQRVALNIMNPDGSNFTGTPPVIDILRFVLVPPSSVNLISRKGITLDYSDCEAVLEYFGLE